MFADFWWSKCFLKHNVGRMHVFLLLEKMQILTTFKCWNFLNKNARYLPKMVAEQFLEILLYDTYTWKDEKKSPNKKRLYRSFCKWRQTGHGCGWCRILTQAQRPLSNALHILEVRITIAYFVYNIKYYIKYQI